MLQWEMPTLSPAGGVPKARCWPSFRLTGLVLICVSHSHATPSDGRGKPDVFLRVALWTHGVLPEGTVNIVHQRLGPSEGHQLLKEARPALGPPMNTAHNNGHPLFQRPSGTQDGRKEMCSSPP